MSYRNGANYKVASALAVASTAVVYSNSFKIKFADVFGLWILATSATSTPNLLIQLEQSYAPPATEGSADANYVIGDGVADIYSALNDEVSHVKSISPIPSEYARFKITGNSGNPSDTVIDIIVNLQEMI